MKRYAAVVALVTIVGVAYVGWIAPTIDQIFNSVSDDTCERASSGEPDRSDPDCQSDAWSGVNHIEEWDRAHPSP